MTETTLDMTVWRGDAAGGAFRGYRVPARPGQTVLDVVTWIQRHVDPGLSYRYACRVGMCGTCAMTVNGKPRWTCRTLVGTVAPDLRLRVAPLANLPVVKDLACDMTAFFDKWRRAEGKFQAPAGAAQDFAAVPPASAARQAADAGIECIGCAVCYAACDVVAWNPGYLGPAALNRAWTLVNDVRDGAGAARLAAVAGDAGCHSCHSHQSCRAHCPKQLNPTAAIAGLKRLAALAALKGEI
ncbi:MAG: succinate dehydrogenase/fumarate reductase iron-sulfur subunit [Alphaproteobacteria bacterium]|nr:succinate dehydrogenase/fumarate reductase iron-sulfur subunit [Alphaproteobacteria bacterium]